MQITITIDTDTLTLEQRDALDVLIGRGKDKSENTRAHRVAWDGCVTNEAAAAWRAVFGWSEAQTRWLLDGGWGARVRGLAPDQARILLAAGFRVEPCD